MNRRVRIRSWFFEKIRNNKKKAGKYIKKVHSIFHGMDFFCPVSFVFCHFLTKKDEKNTASGCVYYTTTRNIRELQPSGVVSVNRSNYTTTRNIRELQLYMLIGRRSVYYTTTRNIRELQPPYVVRSTLRHYTTTRNIRELQPERLPRSDASHYTTTRNIR